MNTSSTNGSERKPRGAVGNMADFFRDFAALVELQGLLFLVDAGDEFRKARNGLLLIGLFAVVGLSCLPLGLAGVAFVLAEETRLTVGQAMLCVAVVGAAIASLVVYVAARMAKPGPDWLQRSRAEWRCNVDWMKETLKHLGDSPRDPRSVPPHSTRH
ncbi:MAG TPA: phage holin family protein [Planctomycetaceae bacterium]